MFGPRHFYYHHGWGWNFLGFLVPLLFFTALIAMVVFVTIRLTHSSSPAGHVPPHAGRVGFDTALEQVRLRYARGELSRDEYTRLIADLGGTPPMDAPPPPPPQPAPSG